MAWLSPCCGSSLHAVGSWLEEILVLASVNGQRGSGDECRAVRCEEDRRGGELIGAAVSAQRDRCRGALRDLVFRHAELGCAVLVLLDNSVRQEPAGQDRIHAD